MIVRETFYAAWNTTLSCGIDGEDVDVMVLRAVYGHSYEPVATPNSEREGGGESCGRAPWL